MLNKGYIWLAVLLCILSNQSKAADLKTFSAGQPISSADINANFKALNDNLPVSGIDHFVIGSQLVTFGTINVPGSVGPTEITFPRLYAAPPVVTLTVVGTPLYNTSLGLVTTSSFQINNPNNMAHTFNYIAIGQY